MGRKRRLPGWLRFWELLKYCLPTEVQTEVYEPTHRQLLRDYRKSRKYRTKGARLWLNFCFALRTLLLFVKCWRAVVKKQLLGLIPRRIRRWWKSLSKRDSDRDEHRYDHED
jgi:hypothetical protein